jgi:hypothetical protein
VEGKVGTTSADAKLLLGGGRTTNAKTTVSTTSVESAPHIRVKARGNLKWEVTDSPSLGELDATYLDNAVLCKAIPNSGANAKDAQLTAYVKQKDTLLHLTKGGSPFAFPSHNHAKMLKILIAKALAASGTQYDGIITFSSAGVEIED